MKKVIPFSKRNILASLSLLCLPLTQCGVTESNLQNPAPSVSYGQPLTAVKGTGKVTIKEGNRTVATLTTASPNIEQTRWYSEQEQIVVKSRGNHGPATVQLFNSRTGAQLGTVKAFELANGGPAWAAGMAD